VKRILSIAVALFTSLPALAAEAPGSFKVLVFSKTAGFRHSSISNGIVAIRRLGTNNNFEVAATENAADFTDANLARFAAVIFLSTTGDVLDATQQSAFERYIRAGGGYVGVHAASDTEYAWPWYGGLVGAWFSSHPAIQKALVLVEDFADPSTRFLPEAWTRTDEWYNFRTNPRSSVHVLARLDETTYTGGTMGADHPIAWRHEYDGGRAWYTAGGHTAESFSEPLFLTHLLGGIRYAVNAVSNPPPGALVLFDGRTASSWTSVTNGIGMPWQVTNGTLTVMPGSGSIRTFQPFEDYLLHVEFSIPPSAAGTPEGSLANSGIYLQNQFEIQILDSYGRPVAGANETGAVWNQRDPSTNAARPTGAWEALDIDFRAARWNANSKIANARASVWWNGVLVQDNVEIPNPTESGVVETPPPAPIRLQDLVGAVQFRNIWLLPRGMTPQGLPVDLVHSGSTWRYLDDGSALSTAWRSNNFADATWTLGRAQFGYGDGDEARVIRSDRTDGTRIITTYFRKSFTATNTSFMTNLELRVLRDDGAIVYLNGTEIFRNNMPNGLVDSLTTASTAIGNAQEVQWVSTNINAALLVEGVNLLAVEIHQSGTNSTDVSFDLALSALRFDPPTIRAERSANQFTFTWPAQPPGFRPERTKVLAPDQWTEVTNSIVTVPGIRSSVTVTNQGLGNFFLRLRKD
jgi:type 1 glutamine amidotransferase